MGIEPTNAGATIRCVNHFATIAILAGVEGINPHWRLWRPLFYR